MIFSFYIQIDQLLTFFQRQNFYISFQKMAKHQLVGQLLPGVSISLYLFSNSAYVSTVPLPDMMAL